MSSKLITVLDQYGSHGYAVLNVKIKVSNASSGVFRIKDHISEFHVLIGVMITLEITTIGHAEARSSLSFAYRPACKPPVIIISVPDM